MLEPSTPLRSLDSQGRPFGTGRSPGKPFSSAPRARREGREVETDSAGPGGRRHARAERDAHRTERRERQWLEEQTRGTRREERAAQEEARASERFEKQRAEQPGEGRGAARGEQRASGTQDGFAPRAEASTLERGAARAQSVAADHAEAEDLTQAPKPQVGDAEGPASLPWSSNTTPLSGANGHAALGTTGAAANNATSGVRAQAAAPQATTGAIGADEPKPAKETARAEAREPVSAPPENERATEIMRQFRMQLNPGLKSALIELAPAELGRIRIEMKLEGGRLRAVVRAEKPEALAALEAHLPELRSALEQQGLVADDLDLGLGFEGGGDARTGGFGAAQRPAAQPVEPEIDQESLARAVARRSGIDFYA
ncbi:MAG: flagellar hook-length control protein FliK [Planctomycetes bacterium]|nr:flagellar hook-length control protein FliK [Planctomycetota bacterium]